MNEKLRWFPASQQPIYPSLTGITYPDSQYHICRPHSEVTVIEYIISGSGFIKYGGNLIPVGANNVYLLCAGSNHEYFSDPIDPWQKVFININGRLASSLPLEFGLPVQGVYSGDGLQDIFLKISEIAENTPKNNDDSILTALFTDALFRLSRIHNISAQNTDAVKMKEIIDSNINRIVSNEELAAAVFRSKDYCIKHFFAEYGLTPYDYQLTGKMQAACDMLKNTSMPISAVAEAVGYSDPQYFSGLFRKKIGVSPREYKRSSLTR